MSERDVTLPCAALGSSPRDRTAEASAASFLSHVCRSDTPDLREHANVLLVSQLPWRTRRLMSRGLLLVRVNYDN